MTFTLSCGQQVQQCFVKLLLVYQVLSTHGILLCDKTVQGCILGIKGSLQNKKTGKTTEMFPTSNDPPPPYLSWELCEVGNEVDWNDSPLGEKLGTIWVFKMQVLGIKGTEMDSGVSHLTNVHVRVLIKN